MSAAPVWSSISWANLKLKVSERSSMTMIDVGIGDSQDNMTQIKFCSPPSQCYWPKLTEEELLFFSPDKQQAKYEVNLCPPSYFSDANKEENYTKFHAQMKELDTLLVKYMHDNQHLINRKGAKKAVVESMLKPIVKVKFNKKNGQEYPPMISCRKKAYYKQRGGGGNNKRRRGEEEDVPAKFVQRNLPCYDVNNNAIEAADQLNHGDIISSYINISGAYARSDSFGFIFEIVAIQLIESQPQDGLGGQHQEEFLFPQQ
jgi:hypothetical protein